jgi:hypothetical protein
MGMVKKKKSPMAKRAGPGGSCSTNEKKGYSEILTNDIEGSTS